ncbi:MAG TPA: glycosyltransferase family 1 protein [Bryobacteraceae bacterium]|nr:glycosyltransferase family 1 protein [Bryobacteraceae bacterium]HPT28627.1 glycosyltransferase family 1 protein [Bryobacteraceae bacterium]
MPLRILIDARHIQDFGFGTYIRNLVRALSGLNSPHRFILVCGRRDQQEFEGLAENFQFLPYERTDSELFDQIAFPAFARGVRADLIHVPLNIVPQLLPRPYVVTVHDISPLFFEVPDNWRFELSRALMRRGLMRAARVIAVSESTRQDVEQMLGIPSSRITRIYSAADPRYARAGTASSPAQSERERLLVLERYQVNYPFLLYAGSVKPQKNVARLVEAFALLRGELEAHPVYKNLRLIIIGDQISNYPALRQAVLHSRVESSVRFLGFVPFDTLRVFYASAAAFVFPSLYEGFGLPPLEAMASGTPVVASNVTSLPEVVGDAAYPVSPDNVFEIARGMREVLLDEGLRERLIARGFQQHNRFNWEETARQVLATYENAGLGR